MPDEESHIFKVQYLYGRHGRRYSRHEREGGCTLPGEICLSAGGLPPLRGGGMEGQKSSEGIVGLSTGLKART